MRLKCEYSRGLLGIGTSRPRLSWQLNPGPRGYRQTAYQVLVAHNEESLERDEGDLWDSGKVASDSSIHIQYDGHKLKSRMRCYWKVRIWDQDGNPSRYSETSWWEMGLLEKSDWKAKWIGLDYPVEDFEGGAPATMLRREIHLDDTPADARVYVSALGLYELYINGERVGGDVLTPGWTDYGRRVQYQTYEVTELLHEGENVIAAVCAEGWYAGRIGWDPEPGKYGKRPKFLFQLEVLMADGSRGDFITDESWRATNEGPVRAASLLDGETRDGRLETEGWDKTGFDDSCWSSASTSSEDVQLVPQYSEPIRVVDEIDPVEVKEVSPGVFVFDMGQNMVGWVRLRMNAERGGEVEIKHAEVLNPDGTIYTDNLRTARQTDTYTASGKGEEVFEPRFTFHGFRYVQVKGLKEIGAGYLTGCVVHSDAPISGSFECSDPVLNRLMENILWTQRGNMVGIPTDCPQRDERLGWTGDAQAFSQTSCYNMNMARFYTKWLQDMRDAQAEDGCYSNFAPNPWKGERFRGAPAWGDAGVIVAWRLYQNYADTGILEQHYESARRWVEFIRENNPDLVWRNERGNDYGDWLNADTLKLEGWPEEGAEVPKEVFATAFFAHSAQLLAKMASVLGREDESSEYEDLAQGIREAFIREFVERDGRIKGDTQAGYALALHFDLVPEELRAAVADHMLRRIEAYGGRVSTGFHGTRAMMIELVRSGHTDAAYKLLNNRGVPSWRHMVEAGGTTIWERWDGYVEGRGFQDPGMNSFNHYAFGSVGEWIYRFMGGIGLDEEVPAYRKAVIQPLPGGRITHAKARYDSVNGMIESSWVLEGGEFRLHLVVPPNSEAEVYIPTSDPSSVTEGEEPIAKSAGIALIQKEEGSLIVGVESGIFDFVSRIS